MLDLILSTFSTMIDLSVSAIICRQFNAIAQSVTIPRGADLERCKQADLWSRTRPLIIVDNA